MPKQLSFTRFAIATATFLTFFTANTQAAPISGQGTWETTLQNRDINSDGIVDAFYDTALNVTWLRNVISSVTLKVGLNGRVTGLLNWNEANTWATTLNVYGTTGWRLPTTNDTGTPGCNGALSGTDCGYNVQTSTGNAVNSELAHLYYVTLGNLAGSSASGQAQTGFGLNNTANFQNFEPGNYWSGTEYAPDAGGAWGFSAEDYRSGAGVQGNYYKNADLSAIAVRSGDVGAAVVPVAPTFALMLPLLGLLALRKRPA
jgi:hypothetical protein